jgi:transcriptional regulator with XRE-family HTH domain
MQVRHLRLKRKMKQGSLAIAVGVSQGFLCDIEHGYAVPSLRVAVLLADALGVTLTALIKDDARASGGDPTGHTKKRSGEKRSGRAATANRKRARA